MINNDILIEKLTGFFRSRVFKEIEDIHIISKTQMKVYFSVYDPHIDKTLLGVAEVLNLEKRNWTIMNIDLYNKSGNKQAAWRNRFIKL